MVFVWNLMYFSSSLRMNEALQSPYINILRKISYGLVVDLNLLFLSMSLRAISDI